MPTPPTADDAKRSRARHLGPERRRPQVLDAALRIAVDDGVGAVTVGAVAAEMGVTRPVVYACFSDRVEIVEALLDRESRILTESLLEALHSSGGFEDPEEAFIAGFRSLLTIADARRDAWRLLAGGQPDPALAERFSAARALVKEHATAWIRPAMRRWWATPDLDHKLPVLIELFMSTSESAVRSLLDESNDWDTEELADFIGRATYRAFKGA